MLQSAPANQCVEKSAKSRQPSQRIRLPNPFAYINETWRHRHIIRQLTRRQIESVHRGSILGWCWWLLNPLLMLAIYTFVFSVVFKLRWGSMGQSRMDFALRLFAGLTLLNLLSECIIQAPMLIARNTTYVKRIVFPLHVLPIVLLFAALFRFAVSMAVLMIFFLIVHGLPPWTLIQLPLAIAPLLLLTLGICWILASLGVFLQDLSQLMTVIVPILTFISPIFYPVEAIPQPYRLVIYLNPLSSIIQCTRDSMFGGPGITSWPWIITALLSPLIAWAGYSLFNRMRSSFADVL